MQHEFLSLKSSLLIHLTSLCWYPIRDPIRDPIRSDPDFVDAGERVRIDLH